jgi:hypothetical protein
VVLVVNRQVAVLVTDIRVVLLRVEQVVVVVVQQETALVAQVETHPVRVLVVREHLTVTEQVAHKHMLAVAVVL